MKINFVRSENFIGRAFSQNDKKMEYICTIVVLFFFASNLLILRRLCCPFVAQISQLTVNQTSLIFASESDR